MTCNPEIYHLKTGREGSEANISAAMLPYLNLLLMMYAGAGLVVSAQLYLEPSVLLAVVPASRLLAVPALLCAAALLLGLLLQAGLANTRRRTVLCTYSVGMTVLVACEAGAAAWLGWQAYCYFAANPVKMLKIYVNKQKIYDEFSAKLYVSGALSALCVTLQVLTAVLATRAPPKAEASQSRDKNTLLLSCMGPTSNTPRCLRPLSGADYMPSSYLESDNSRRSMRSKGWQLQPQVGWKRG